jgi:trk system potassium uptake protein TrkH
MRYFIILRYVGFVLLLNAGFMFISYFISVYNNDTAQIPLLLSAILTTLIGLFPAVFVPSANYISNKEAYIIVVVGWLAVCLFGTLPYIVWGGEFSFTNAWFESVSGYTTTGSSILNNVEALPNGLLFWRSSTHWLGGIGVILFVLVILPALGKTRMSLSRLEMSPLAKTNFHYRTNKTLRVVIIVYLVLTVVQAILLYYFGMSLFDAITHTFGTVATAGFSTKNNSIAYFNSIPIEVVIIIFMFLGGMHFGVIFSIFTFKDRNWYKSPVLKFYFFSILVGILFVTISNKGNVYVTWGESLRHAAFQVVSIGTTSGFATTNTAVWPSFSVLVLVYFSFQSACAGSTVGGIKVDRLVIFYQSLRRQVVKLQHQNAIVPVRFNDQPIDDETVDSVLLFIVLFLLILFINGLALSAMGLDLMTAFSASAATLTTAGPGFGEVGSASNYSIIPDLGKILLTLNMLLGRLEIFGLMLLFFMKSWK